MFERYTEKARRVIFFARYEASNFGSPRIETEHMLLGLLREDLPLMQSVLGESFTDPPVRKEIENRTGLRAKISTSADLPLSDENKRVLAYAAQEADRLCSAQIGPEHLLFGLLQEKESLAALILNAYGLRIETLRSGRQPSSEEQHRWKASRRRNDRIYRWLQSFNGVFVILFGLGFVQVLFETSAHHLSHSDAVDYAIGFPILTATTGALLFWQYRRRRLPQKWAQRYLVVMTGIFFATMGMVFAGLQR
jgi:Clp amino terminal domain, pathogenicity island component